MKVYTAFFLLALIGVILFSGTVKGTYQREYRIEVRPDGSAILVIEHRFIKGENESLFRQLSDPIYFSDTFAKNIKSLVSTAAEKTGRLNMTAKNFVMTASVLDSYSVVKYQFYWIEFAGAEDSRVKIGDVFGVEGLFLYGEGTVKIVYPREYIVESVSPTPHAESNQTLTWYGIEDFRLGEPKIVLRERGTYGFMEIIQANAILIAGSIALVGVGSISFYYYFFKARKKVVKGLIISAKAPLPLKVPKIEDAEETVMNLLRTAGGSLYQSTIADQCEFSRSKTSKLLATMESKGKITRKEKGREKVVTLIGEVKEFEKTKRRDSH